MRAAAAAGEGGGAEASGEAEEGGGMSDYDMGHADGMEIGMELGRKKALEEMWPALESANRAMQAVYAFDHSSGEEYGYWAEARIACREARDLIRALKEKA